LKATPVRTPPLQAFAQARARAGLWMRHLSFMATPAGRALRAAKRRRDENAWSETLPSGDGVLFRLSAWPDVVPAGGRACRLRTWSALSVGPFSFDELVALAHEDRELAAELFVELMVVGCLEVCDPSGD
jgi:hypothetical protein